MRQRSVQIGDGLSDMSGALALDIEFEDHIRAIFDDVRIVNIGFNDFADAAGISFEVDKDKWGHAIRREGIFVKCRDQQTGILFVFKEDYSYFLWLTDGKSPYVDIFCGRKRLNPEKYWWQRRNPITFKEWNHSILGLIEQLSPEIRRSLHGSQKGA